MPPKKSFHGKYRRRHDKVAAGEARVLLIVLEDLAIDNSEDIILNMFWVMAQFGVVEKISRFLNNDMKEQVLVQFKESTAAEVAMSYLNTRDGHFDKTNGHAARPWSCKFAIVPSSVSQLTFKKEDERNREFTAFNDKLQCGDELPIYDFIWGKYIQGEGWLCPKQPDCDKGMIPTKQEGLPKGEVGVCVYLASLPDISAEQLFRVGGQYGVVVAAKMLQKHSGKALLQYEKKGDAETARKKLDGVQLFGKKLVVKQSPHANALHWNGVQTEEPKLYSMKDAPPPEPCQVKNPPSRFVWLKGSGDEIENAVVLHLHSKNALQPVMKRCPTHTILDFMNIEDAFKCVMHLNGRTCQLAGGFEFRFSMGFDQPDMLIPLTAPLLHHDLRSATMPTASTPAPPLVYRMKADKKETIQGLLVRLELNEYGYFEKLDSEGYERASDLGGSQPEKLEKLGIKAGHVRRMLNDVESYQFSHEAFVPQQFEEELASRAKTAPPNVIPNFNLIAEQDSARNGAGPLITKSVCIDPQYTKLMAAAGGNVVTGNSTGGSGGTIPGPVAPAPVPMKAMGSLHDEEVQRSMTCPTSTRRGTAQGGVMSFITSLSGSPPLDDLSRRTKTCPGGPTPPLFGERPDEDSDEILQRLSLELQSTGDMARTKTAPMAEDEQFVASGKITLESLLNGTDFWSGERSQTLPGRPR